MNPDFVTVTCPSCFEAVEIASPPAAELPAELDYDCPVCCRPFLLRILWDEEEGACGEAVALDE